MKGHRSHALRCFFNQQGGWSYEYGAVRPPAAGGKADRPVRQLGRRIRARCQGLRRLLLGASRRRSRRARPSPVSGAEPESPAPELDHSARGRVRGAGGPPARLLHLASRPRRPDARAAAAGRARLVHRRLLGRAEPDEGDPRRRSDARLLAGLDRRHRRDQGRHDRRLPDGDRPRNRALRRPGQPDRRLPGRVARGDLHRAVSRAGEHAHARRRADRLPLRRAGDRRGRAAAGARAAIFASTRRWSRSTAACSRASTCSPGS